MSKAEVATNYVVIAEYAELYKNSIRKLIDNHMADFEQLVKVSFEMTKITAFSFKADYIDMSRA